MLSTLLPSKNKSPRTGKPWAKDVLKVSFQGIETLEQKETATSPSNGSDQSPSNPSGPVGPRQPDTEEGAIMIAEGHMETAIPAGLLVKQHVDKDIAFHPSTSAFAFRLKARVGEPSITPLIERLQRVERLVDFVQVINAHPESLHCESVSLSRLIFSYGCVQSPSPNHSHTESPRYQAIIDFSSQSSRLELQLEAGNPHIRILDHLTKILNSPLGLHGLATILPLTLPILRALDTAEDSWEDIPSSELQILCRAADWYAVRYILTPPSDGDNNSPAAPKRVVFEIRLQRRGNVPWWCIRRDQKHNPATMDPLDLALKEKVWTGGEKGVWMGMQCAAIAQISGAEAMVLRVDTTMRDMTKDGTVFASDVPEVTGVKGEGAPVANMEGLGGHTGQAQAHVVNAPNKVQPQRPQTKSPVIQKQTQKKAQGMPQTQQQRTQAALAEAQHRAQLQAQQQLARQKEMHRQAQAQARGQGQGQQRPNANPNSGNGNSGKQDAIVID